MTHCKSSRGFVLGLHPTSRGVGWAVFESPLSPVDWAIMRTNKNDHCLRLIEQVLDRYTPVAVVLEEFEAETSGKVDRIQRLCRGVTQLAINRGMDARTYSQAAVRTCFASVGAVTRYEIAQAVALHVPALRHRLPRKRTVGRNADARMSLFVAAALAMAHHSFTGDQLRLP